jgi:hypothetical protein
MIATKKLLPEKTFFSRRYYWIKYRCQRKVVRKKKTSLEVRFELPSSVVYGLGVDGLFLTDQIKILGKKTNGGVDTKADMKIVKVGGGGGGGGGGDAMKGRGRSPLRGEVNPSPLSS